MRITTTPLVRCSAILKMDDFRDGTHRLFSNRMIACYTDNSPKKVGYREIRDEELTMNDKLFEMMFRHAAALFASDELTLLKAQIGDLMDALEAKETPESIRIHVNDVSGSMSMMDARLDIIRQTLDMIESS
jgi:hypothetical protein